MISPASLCATARLPIKQDDTASEAWRQGVPESWIWNARKSGDSIIRTPACGTRDLIDEILWWHNAIYGTDITYDAIMTRTRRVVIVNARSDVMKRLREVKGWSYPRIGDYFGGMDHTSVIHMIRRPTMYVRGITKPAQANRAAKRKAGANERKANDQATMEASSAASQAGMVQQQEGKPTHEYFTDESHP
jgi:hypothetical protein